MSTATTPKTLTLTHSALIHLVRGNIKGTSAITLELDSDMDGKRKMLLTGNPYAGKGMVKRETLSGLIGYNYGNSVNRLAAKEGKEERLAKPHPWGDMDPHHLFRIHRSSGKHYLSMKVQSVHVHGYFLPNGEGVNTENVKPFLPIKHKSSTQADLDGEIIARDFNLDNIKEIRMLGMVITLIPDSALQEITENKGIEAAAKRIMDALEKTPEVTGI